MISWENICLRPVQAFMESFNNFSFFIIDIFVTHWFQQPASTRLQKKWGLFWSLFISTRFFLLIGQVVPIHLWKHIFAKHLVNWTNMNNQTFVLLGKAQFSTIWLTENWDQERKGHVMKVALSVCTNLEIDEHLDSQLSPGRACYIASWRAEYKSNLLADIQCFDNTITSSKCEMNWQFEAVHRWKWPQKYKTDQVG